MNNCFLATKISYMNEMKLLSNKVNANWDQAIEGFIADPRVGNSHFNVPGMMVNMALVEAVFQRHSGFN